MATLDNGLNITHGPLDMTTTGATCSDAHVAWLPVGRRLVMVARDGKNDTISRSVWDESLAPVAPSAKLASSAH